MKPNYAFKAVHIIDGNIQSDFDGSPWKLGEWREASGELVPCENGLHFSKLRGAGWIYMGNTLTIVQIGKERRYDERGAPQWEKGVARKMRIVKILDLDSIIEDLISMFTHKEGAYEERMPTNVRLYYLAIDTGQGSEILKEVLTRLAPEYL